MVERLKEAQLLREQRKRAEPVEEPEPYGDEYGDDAWDAAIEDEGDYCMHQVVQE